MFKEIYTKKFLFFFFQVLFFFLRPVSVKYVYLLNITMYNNICIRMFISDKCVSSRHLVLAELVSITESTGEGHVSVPPCE